MKYHPILFSGPLVRAILEGRKTQTRRLVKRIDGVYDFGRSVSVGDRLWVRETWHTDEPDLALARAQHEDALSPSPIFYRASPAVREFRNAGWRWRSSIHMPRWASRIALEVTDVRVQRAHEITAEDVRAEGVEESDIEKWRKWVHKNDAPGSAFAELWSSIYTKPGERWGDNPLVWAYTFRRVKGQTQT